MLKNKLTYWQFSFKLPVKDLFGSFHYHSCSWQILDEIDEHGIKIYHLPDAESDEDEDFKEQTRILKVHLSVIISFNEVMDVKSHETP